MKYEKNKLYKDYDGNLVQFLSENTIPSGVRRNSKSHISGNKILILKYLKSNCIYTYDNELYELTEEDKVELL